MKENNVLISGRGDSSGYIVEWRLAEDVKVISDRPHNSMPEYEWQQCPYDIEQLRLTGQAKGIVRPYISFWDSMGGLHSITAYGLVSEEVADALVACYKTFVLADSQLRGIKDSIEIRKRLCELTYDFKVTKKDNDNE